MPAELHQFNQRELSAMMVESGFFKDCDRILNEIASQIVTLTICKPKYCPTNTYLVYIRNKMTIDS